MTISNSTPSPQPTARRPAHRFNSLHFPEHRRASFVRSECLLHPGQSVSSRRTQGSTPGVGAVPRTSSLLSKDKVKEHTNVNEHFLSGSLGTPQWGIKMNDRRDRRFSLEELQPSH